MNNPNLTMEEYIRLEEEKAHKHGKVFDWQTATYGKIRVDDDLHNLSSVEAEFPAIVINDDFAPQDALQYKSQPVISCFDDLDFFNDFENEFPAIVYNDAQKSESDLLTRPILNPQHIDEFDLNNKTSLSEYDEEEQNVLYFNDLFPFNIICSDDLKSEKDNDNDMALPPRGIHMREVHRVPVFNFGGLLDLMVEGLTARLTMEHRDKSSVGLFTSRAWRRMFDIRVPLVHELILEFFSTFRFGHAILDLHTPGLYKEEMQMAGFGVYWAGSARQIPDKGDLRDYWMGILSARDFLGIAPSYTLIRDPILRMCHWLIACSIAGRSQAPKKVTVTYLFYLRGMDVRSVNVLYLLARYLRLFSAGRKSEAHISGGQFVARSADHFGLLIAEIPGGFTVIATELLVIDMAELVRLQISVELDNA
ncbi:hypothetical protein Tco_0548577 [Tanacetum coccineum]